MTTGSSIQCVHWIERGRFSGCRFLNYVSITYRFEDIDVLVFKGDFALKARFLGGKGGQKKFFKILTPKRHILARKHAVWYIQRENRMNGVTCSLTEEPRKKKNYYLVLYFGYSPGSNPLTEDHEIWQGCSLAGRNHLVKIWFGTVNFFLNGTRPKLTLFPLQSLWALPHCSRYRVNM